MEVISDIAAIGHLLVLFLGALMCLLLEVVPWNLWMQKPDSEARVKRLKKGVAGTVGFLTVLVSFVLLLVNQPLFLENKKVFSEALFVDPLVWLFSLLLLIALMGSLLIAVSSAFRSGIESIFEVVALYLFVGFGALVFLSAASFLVVFVGLEIFSLALYALAACAIGVRASTEAAIKYFILGSFSSCILLYGIALAYGVTGSLQIQSVLSDDALTGMGGTLALGLIMGGVIFKIGAFPMHFWVPDTYEGAPLAVTALMASLVKVASFGLLIRLIWLLSGEANLAWEGLVWILAFLSMVVGNVAALRQSQVVRIIAYSSIAQAGYLLVGLMAGDLMTVVSFYLFGYVIVTLALFSSLAILGQPGLEFSLDSIRGVARRYPIVGLAVSFALLSLAGLPPGLAGLFGKLYLLQEVMRTGYTGLGVIALLCSVIGCYYYVNIIVAIWSVPLVERERGSTKGHGDDDPTINSDSVVRYDVSLASDGLCHIVLLTTTVTLLLLSLFPEYVYPWLRAWFNTVQ